MKPSHSSISRSKINRKRKYGEIVGQEEKVYSFLIYEMEYYSAAFLSTFRKEKVDSGAKITPLFGVEN